MKQPWTDAEVRLLTASYPTERTADIAASLKRTIPQVYNKAHELGLKKTDEYLRINGGRLAGKVGAATRFKAGTAPWNAGLKGYAAPGTERTRFVKGRKPHNTVPVGTEVRDKDGYVKRKIRDDAPTGQSRKNWAYVHTMLWELNNGPVPPGHAVVFRDGNKENIVIENLELISRAELAGRNTIHRYPPELVATMQLLGRVKKKIERKAREEQN